MTDTSYFRLQFIVFTLVSASFTNIYITQPVLPILQKEFSTDMVLVSFTVSAVIFGIALSNLPFGLLADRLPIHPIVLTGGLMVVTGSLICAVTHNLFIFIGARFLQGVFIPALTTCLAAYLSKTLPVSRLNVVMGSYVSATVIGGMSGRLLGGWIHPPLHWRYAFISASALILIATLTALMGLPRTPGDLRQRQGSIRYFSLLKQWKFLSIFFCAAGSFAIFSSIFNYLPFRLTGSPFHFSTEITTLIYLVYIVGVFMAPTAGRMSDRFGSGNTLLAGTIVFGTALALLLMPFIYAIICGLLIFCAGFFTIHAAAVGALNRKLSSGQGQANALYVLFYYLGGWIGITCSGLAYKLRGWNSVILICFFVLIIPLTAGIAERKRRNDQSDSQNFS